MEVLKPYRDRIDVLDNKIIDLLAERMDIVREVGATKAREKIDLIQWGRVDEVRERCAARGEVKKLNPDMVRKIYTLIIDEAHQLEQDIISKS